MMPARVRAILLGATATVLCIAQTPTMRITVTLVQLDAVVTDGTGRHVMDLMPGEFEILQDGQIQPVTFFSPVPGQPPPRMEGPLVSTPLTSASQVKRAIALVVDDMALSWENLVRTRDALKHYVETEMRPGDLVSVVRTGGGVAILEQFTTDKRILLESIASLRWRFSGRQGLGQVLPRDDDPAAKRRDGAPEYLDYHYTLSALGALGTVEQVIQGMKRFPGRKSVVFFSDNLRMDGNIYAAIDHLTDMANRSMVTLYAVDPGGLKMRGPREDPVIAARDTESMERFPGFAGADLDDETARQAGLEALAGRTGGIYYHDRNDLESCIREAADDQLGYYMLGYSPAEGTFDGAGRGKFHKVTVRVKRPGLKVRWKSGFEGRPDQLEISDAGDGAKSRERQIMEALASPFTATGIRVRLTSIYVEPAKIGPVVYSLLHFDGTNVTFEKEGDTWKARLDVVWIAYTGVNKPMWQGQKQLNLSFTEDEYRTAQRDGVVMPVSLRARQAGLFLLRTVVRDVPSERIGSASQYVDVPDTSKGKLGMTGIVLRQADAAVIAATGSDQIIADAGWTQGGPALRRFRPGQGVVYGYSVINPKRRGAEKTPAVVQFVRVYRNGKLIYTGPETRWVVPTAEAPNQFRGGGVLRLGAQLLPGEYLLQVVVKDEQGKKKAPPLTQWIDFEVTQG